MNNIKTFIMQESSPPKKPEVSEATFFFLGYLLVLFTVLYIASVKSILKRYKKPNPLYSEEAFDKAFKKQCPPHQYMDISENPKHVKLKCMACGLYPQSSSRE